MPVFSEEYITDAEWELATNSKCRLSINMHYQQQMSATYLMLNFFQFPILPYLVLLTSCSRPLLGFRYTSNSYAEVPCKQGEVMKGKPYLSSILGKRMLLHEPMEP